MNIITKLYRRIFECSRGEHTLFLQPDELQILHEVNLMKFCQVCKREIILKDEDENSYWEIENSDD